MERLQRTAEHFIASSPAAALVDVASLPPEESDEHYDEAGWRIYRQVLDEGLVGEAKQHISWLGEQHPELRPENYGHTLVREPNPCNFASLRGQPALRLPQCLARVLNPDHPNIRYAVRL